jgi:hypothetical protein
MIYFMTDNYVVRKLSDTPRAALKRPDTTRDDTVIAT